MKSPCETVAHRVLPALRAGVVRILHDDYKMKQTEIASVLGITQASVSQYLAGARAKEKNFPFIKRQAISIARRLYKEKPNQIEIVSIMCSACIATNEKMECCRASRKK